MSYFSLKIALFASTNAQIVRADTSCGQLASSSQASCLSEQRVLGTSIGTPTCWSCDSMICRNQAFAAGGCRIWGYSIYGTVHFCERIWVDRRFSSFLGNGAGVWAAWLLREKRIGDCSHNFVVWIHLCWLFLFPPNWLNLLIFVPNSLQVASFCSFIPLFCPRFFVSF